MGDPIPAEAITFRTWRARDVEALVRHANDREVWLGLADRFPHPYTEHDAEDWIGMNHANLGPPKNLAIEVGGEAIGGVGVDPGEADRRICGRIGYWVGRTFWGRGVGTRAVEFITYYGFRAFLLERLEAQVFDWNAASVRVLEKAGYSFEGRLRRAVIKEGRIGDLLMYGCVRYQ